jgi:Flp pilus assembly pilin Flp
MVIRDGVRKIGRAEDGATAIEYAILAVAIGLGIVGALTASRSSLQQNFNTVATDISGGVDGTPPAPTYPLSQRPVLPASSSSRYAFWTAKTLTSKTVTASTPTGKTTTFAYSDGTSATFTQTFDANGALVGETVLAKPSNFAGRLYDQTQFTYDAAGNQTVLNYTDQYSPGQVRQTTYSTAASGWAEYVTLYNTSGGVTSAGYYSNTTQGVLDIGRGDEIYFRALSQ